MVVLRCRRLQLTAGVQVSTTGSSSNTEQRHHANYAAQCRRHHHHHHHSQHNDDATHEDRYSDDNDSMSSYNTASRRCCVNARRTYRDDAAKLCTSGDYDDDWRDATIALHPTAISATTVADDVDQYDHVTSIRQSQSYSGQWYL